MGTNIHFARHTAVGTAVLVADLQGGGPPPVHVGHVADGGVERAPAAGERAARVSPSLCLW